MPKLVFEFESDDDMHTWFGYYSNGGGENSIYNGWKKNEETDYPEIKITKED